MNTMYVAHSVSLSMQQSYLGYCQNRLHACHVLRLSLLEILMTFLSSLISIVPIFFVLSIVVKRVIEIIKGVIPPLAKQQTNVTAEYIRYTFLQVLSVL